MTFNLWTFLLELLNFLVLVFVLQRLFYRPLTDAIERRKVAHERALADAEQARAQALELQQQLQTKLTGIDQERQQAIGQLHAQMETERQRMKDETERALQRRRDEARVALERERSDTFHSLHTDIVNQAVDLSQRLLREAADVTLHQQLTRHLMEVLRLLPESDRDKLRRDWRPQDGVLLETAIDADEDSTQQVSEILSTILRCPVKLEVQTHAELIGGVRLRLAGQVWDASIAGQLDKARDTQARETAHV